MPDLPPSSPETSTERLIDALLRGLFAIRIPLALGVLSILVLTLSDQVLEVHRVLTQERAQNIFNVHWLLSLVSLVALSVVLWQLARQHAEYAAEDAGRVLGASTGGVDVDWLQAGTHRSRGRYGRKFWRLKFWRLGCRHDRRVGPNLVPYLGQSFGHNPIGPPG